MYYISAHIGITYNFHRTVFAYYMIQLIVTHINVIYNTFLPILIIFIPTICELQQFTQAFNNISIFFKLNNKICNE